MGYTTYFDGSFNLDKELLPEHKAYLNKFAETRRMARDPEIAENMDDPIRIAAGLPIGENGMYFTGGVGDYGQGNDPSILNYNLPSKMPGLWCQWIPTEDGDALEWDEGEKFYNSVEWIEFIIKHFLTPWGYIVKGEVTWKGEDQDDLGKILVEDSKVTVLHGKVVYE